MPTADADWTGEGLFAYRADHGPVQALELGMRRREWWWVVVCEGQQGVRRHVHRASSRQMEGVCPAEAVKRESKGEKEEK